MKRRHKQIGPIQPVQPTTVGFVKAPAGSTITSTGPRYFQYRALFSSTDPFVSAELNIVSTTSAPFEAGHMFMNGLKLQGIQVN